MKNTNNVSFKGIYGYARVKGSNEERKIYFPLDDSSIEVKGSKKDGFTIKKVSDEKFDKVHIYNVDNSSRIMLLDSAQIFVNSLGYQGCIMQCDKSESDIFTVKPQTTLWLKDGSSTYVRDCNGRIILSDRAESEINYLKNRANLSVNDAAKVSITKAHKYAFIHNNTCNQVEIEERVLDD